MIEAHPTLLAIGADLGTMIEKNKSEVSVFSGKYTTQENLTEYICRLFRYFKCSIVIPIIAVIYLIRFTSTGGVSANASSIHRLFFTAMVLAVKFQEDDIFANSYYAKVGGVHLSKLNEMERHMLTGLKHRLFISYDAFSITEQYFAEKTVQEPDPSGCN